MCPDLAIPALTAAVLRSHQCHRGAPEGRRCLTRRVARSLCATTEAAMGSARPERRLRLWERLQLQERVQRRRLELELHLHLIRAVRRDRQEAARPCGQGGPASPEPAAVQERITPARACGRLAARHSEAFLRVVAVEHARLRDRLLQPLAEARTARLESRPPWRSTFIHSSLGRSRKVSSGSMVGARKSAHIKTTRSRSPAVRTAPDSAFVNRCAQQGDTFLDSSHTGTAALANPLPTPSSTQV